jgi:hypothetical protein
MKMILGDRAFSPAEAEMLTIMATEVISPEAFPNLQ